ARTALPAPAVLRPAVSARAEPHDRGRMTASSEDVRERIRALEGTGLRTFWEPEPLVWTRTEGCHVWDAEGRSYLDLYAGFAVANVGYCHPRVTEAIRGQAGGMTHCPSAAPSGVRPQPYARLL